MSFSSVEILGPVVLAGIAAFRKRRIPEHERGKDGVVTRRPARGIYNPEFVRGGSMTGVRFDTQNPYRSVEPGDDLLLVKAIVRVNATADPGEYSIVVHDVDASTREARAFAVTIESGTLYVVPPRVPRPVFDLTCAQSGSDVDLSWKLTEEYEAIRIERNGVTVGTLDGTATSFRDTPTLGATEYRVIASREGAESFPAECELLVQTPRPPTVGEFTCTQANGNVALSWENSVEYDLIRIFRNRDVIAELAGTMTSYDDPWTSNTIAIYTVQAQSGGVDALPANCKVNDLSDLFVFWAEEIMFNRASGQPKCESSPRTRSTRKASRSPFASIRRTSRFAS